jgi:hypothetical protein
MASVGYEHLDARMGASEARIADLSARAEDALERVGAGEARAEEDRARIGALEDRADVDAALIAALQAEGAVSREHTANLEVALRSSRTIGAAIGILMTKHHLPEEQAFQMLRKVSMDTNRKLRDLADEVVRTGEVSPQEH